ISQMPPPPPAGDGSVAVFGAVPGAGVVGPGACVGAVLGSSSSISPPPLAAPLPAAAPGLGGLARGLFGFFWASAVEDAKTSVATTSPHRASFIVTPLALVSRSISCFDTADGQRRGGSLEDRDHLLRSPSRGPAFASCRHVALQLQLPKKRWE